MNKNILITADDYNIKTTIDGYCLSDYVGIKNRLFFSEHENMSLNDVLDDYQISSKHNRSTTDINLLYRKIQNDFAFRMFGDNNFLECPITGIYEVSNGETWYSIESILTNPVHICTCCDDRSSTEFVISISYNLITFKMVQCHSSEQIIDGHYQKVKDLLPIIEDFKLDIRDGLI